MELFLKVSSSGNRGPSLGPRPNQPQHGSPLVSRACVILKAIHALDKRSGNETKVVQNNCDSSDYWSGRKCIEQWLGPGPVLNTTYQLARPISTSFYSHYVMYHSTAFQT